jgi:hypothetical protein
VFGFGHLNAKIHNTLSNQNRLQCSISKDDSRRGQAVRKLSGVSANPLSLEEQVDNGAHQKKTAQNICTTFLLNDTSEARTIAVAWLQGLSDCLIFEFSHLIRPSHVDATHLTNRNMLV